MNISANSNSHTSGTRADPDQAYRRQISYLMRRSVFYRDKLRAMGLRNASDVGGIESIAELPFTTKDELRESQEEDPPFGRHLAASAGKLARVYSTSGTTGAPRTGQKRSGRRMTTGTYAACAAFWPSWPCRQQQSSCTFHVSLLRNNSGQIRKKQACCFKLSVIRAQVSSVGHPC